MHASHAALAAALLLASLATPATAAPQGPSAPAPTVTRIVTLDSAPPTRDRTTANRRAALAEVDSAQRELLSAADRAGVDATVVRRYRHVVNGLAVTLPASQAARLATLPGVSSVSEPVVYEAPESPTPVSADLVSKAVADAGAAAAGRTRADEEPSGREIVTVTDLTGVPEVHRDGVTGRGVTVGIVDSGIAYDHPALGGGGFPNAKVVGGHDFADNDADPYDDAAGSAAGHGTHVAGIVAGSDGHIQGVAPAAQLRAYRVFGSGGGAGEDVVLAALDRAAADGVDAVNMSLGSSGGARANSVLSAAVDRLVGSGTPVAVAVGNGYAGPFRASSPAVADEAIAVGSTYSDRSPYLAFRLGDETRPVAYTLSGRGANTPSTGSAPYAVMPSSCAPLPEGSLRGKIALFTPAKWDGTGTICRPMDLARTAEAAGAVAAVNHDPQMPADAIPGSPCCGTSAIPVLGISEADARRVLAKPAGTELSWGAYAGIPLKEDAAGLMDHGSAWGPGNELEFKPDIAAPGGYILSAMPKSLDWYGVASGTSMASPHVTGVIALLLEKNPGLSPRELRTTLQNTATPLGMTGDPSRGAQPVAQQGAGRVDAAAAVASVTRAEVAASPSELALKDLEGRSVTRQITVRNDSEETLTYEVGHRSAVSAAPPYTSEWQADDAGAAVRVGGPERITLRPHSSRTVPVHVRQPEGVPEGTLFGGWVEFVPTSGQEPVLRVPYQGMAGDYDAVSAINPTFSALNTTLDNPALRPAEWNFGKNLPLTVDLTDTSTANDQAVAMLSHGYPLLKRMRLNVLNASGAVVATPYDESWITRISGAGTGVDFYPWDATLSDGSPAPAGMYRLRFVFDKALGDRDHAPGTETWTSPDVTLVR
ncbi:S8 family serine peptidase [Streptomyces sp. NPDC091287]|uniref:S8 family serine peptidase n=1 Tax=Streptomyces sp. NPDC091287 TaxID=3365988 RepID=UPI0038075B0A